MTLLENQLQFTAQFVSTAFKDLFFVSIVFITAETMLCIHIILSSKCEVCMKTRHAVPRSAKAMGFEKFFDSHMWNLIGKLKMIK